MSYGGVYYGGGASIGHVRDGYDATKYRAWLVHAVYGRTGDGVNGPVYTSTMTFSNSVGFRDVADFRGEKQP